MGDSITCKSVLKSMSKKNLKHSIKHLDEFRSISPSITPDKLRKIGASQKMFQGVVKIGDKSVTVRSVLNPQ